ncbi:MAG: HEAT repeat domain-containing protein, partial [Planctomycetes bacterium]|nr:HEAT repeat domain-containing protein [Planctomycetota bacterium]
MIAGEKDPLVPFESQVRSVELARKLLQTDPSKATSHGHAQLEPGANGTELATYLHPGGHEWPTDATPLVVKFFQRHANSQSSPDRDTASGVHQVQLNGHTFTLPVGFNIELVAGPPLVDRPISAAFDEQGRLYVSDSSGSNDKVEKQLEDKPHRIVRLEDSDGDGRFDKSLVFADKMMFPEGTMWFDGSLYVAAAPSIWKLTDTNGDGVADQREEWFMGKTLGHCANDLHGPYRGPDGWIYWCKGAFAKQTYERVGKSLRVIPGTKPDESPAGMQTWSTRASHIFRCRPDGAGLEVVMTGGMDNPVDVVFTPSGERIFSTTFLVHPGGGRRDGLLHAAYGGVYGKSWEVIDDHKHTGDVMPVLTHHGAAASCGLHRYESHAFGPEYENNLFACLFNMHKITRHVLESDGATFKTRDEDFLVSGNLDFHPTDVLEDTDGSLIVVDTGGWYKLCCPTSQLHKPDILGAVYRVRREDAPPVDDPRGLKLAWSKMTPKDLADLLGDSRPGVRSRATQELSKQGAQAIAALRRATSPRATSGLVDGKVVHFPETSVAELQAAIWALTRIDHPDARAAVRSTLSDRNDTVRQAAIHSVSLWRDRNAVPQLVWLLRSDSAHNRRAAAEALGRIGDKSVVPALLAAAAKHEPAGDVREPALRQELLAMMREDQKARADRLKWVDRKELSIAGANSKVTANKELMQQVTDASKQLRELDAKNTARMKEIVEGHGWPGKRLVGSDGAGAAWLLVQHADRDLPFQKRCLELLQTMPTGEVEPRNIAYLIDRVRVAENKKQLYGTQFASSADGQFQPLPIEDADSVDERRAAVGLPPLKEYLAKAKEGLARFKEGETTRPDRVLEHSLIYALIEIADAKQTAAGLESENSWTRRAALIALSEMDGGGLAAETVSPLLSSSDPVIKETATWIVSRHADWGGALAGHFRQRLGAGALSDPDRTELQQQLARFARSGAVQDLIAGSLQEPSISPAARRVALAAMRDSGVKEKELPIAWITALVQVLSGDDTETVHAAVAAARALPVPKEHTAELAAALLKVGQNPDTPAP